MKRWPALQGGLLFHRLSPMDNHCNLKNGVVSCPLLMFHRLSPMDNHCNLLPYAIAWPWFVVPSLNPDGQPLQHRESIRLRLGFSRSIAQSRWTTTATRARQAARVLVKEFHRSIPMDNHCNREPPGFELSSNNVPSLNPDGQPLQHNGTAITRRESLSSIAQSRWTTTATICNSGGIRRKSR